ncbi:WD repeat and HMG-box DNA-binding protein 1 [Tupaia chinensis]|uniref:WD repeat and HMG-box DNA-binding protein 1 n=1 Tax=Tupaia chinensis TaxID=246437 RepID=L9J9T9_TUPCH|nr:WD repeat and HMG-box DNA-binding protein 1 [Tupaia chinensis]
MRYGHTEGHTDVCFDDSGSCIVTCGSDGDVRIWEDLDDDDPKSINVGEKAFSCALKNGKLVTAVSNNTVQVHTFPEGVPDGILTRFTTNANHVVFNGDGTKIAAGSRVKHEKGYAICGLAWHPTLSQISYTDAEGNLGLLENVCDPSGKMSSSKASSRVEKDYNDLFDEDDASNGGDFLNDNAVEIPSLSKGIINDDEDDDNLMLASGHLRQRSNVLEDDENSVGTGFDGDQCLGVQLLELGKRKKQILHGDPLPLTRKSYLAWIGFSAEGSRFPPTLPRPAVAILPFKLPYCQITTEKGQMEEQFWRSVIFHNYLDYLAKNGYEYEESTKNQATKEQQELLMKMLALSCKLEREFRCVELADLMTQNAVNLAIKYASRSRKLILAQRLSELAVEKAAELAVSQAEQEEEEEEDFRKKLNAGYSNTATEWSQPRLRNQVEEDDKDSGETDDLEEKPEIHIPGQNPFSKCADSSDVPSKSGAVTCSNQGRVNPFKASAASYFQKRTSPADKAEELKEENLKNSLSETPAICPESTENQKPKTGFQIWLEENRGNILSDNPDFSEEADIIKEGMIRFRVLSAEERKAWTKKAKGETASDEAEAKKRKRVAGESDETENQEEKEKENLNAPKKQKSLDLSTNQKLSAFAFKQE